MDQPQQQAIHVVRVGAREWKALVQQETRMTKTTAAHSSSSRQRHEDEPEQTGEELAKPEAQKPQEQPEPEAPDMRNAQVKQAEKFGERKVMTVAGNDQAAIAVCSDHSLWRISYNSGLDPQWSRLPPIPQDDPRDPNRRTVKGEGHPAVEG